MQDLAAEIDLAWLAGIVDGEGTICVIRPGSGQKPYIRFAIYNSNYKLIERSLRILSTLTDKAINHNVKTRCRKGKNLTVWQIAVSRRKSVRSILTALLPYLVGKAYQARLAVAVIDSRKAGSKAPFNRKARAFMEAITFANHNPPTPEKQELN